MENHRLDTRLERALNIMHDGENDGFETSGRQMIAVTLTGKAGRLS